MKCGKCKLELPDDRFYKTKHTKSGLMHACIECVRENKKRWKKANPEKVKAQRRREGLRRNGKAGDRLVCYGFTEEVYQEVLKKQNNTCAICKIAQPADKRFSIDHCHATGKIRGLLCQHCNFGLGHFRDNIAVLENAIEYLKEHE